MPVATLRRLALGSMMVAVLAACQPTPPLLSPLETARRFGYTDRQIGDGRLEVGYTTPRRLVTSFSLRPTDADTEPVRRLALDLALWHAGELGLARGYAGLRIIARDTVVDSHPEPTYGIPELAAGPWPYLRSPSSLVYGGTTVPSLSVRARATVTVELVALPQADDLDAAALIAGLRARYPDAQTPPPAAATSPRS